MKFKEFFYLEAFDYVPENINKTLKDRGKEVDISYEFSIGRLTYDVVFSIQKDTKSTSFLFSNTNEEYEEHPMSILNTGEKGASQKVFGAVINIFNQFITQYIRYVKDVYFIANKNDKNRARLYDRFVTTGFIKNNFDVDIDDRDAIRKYILTPKINANDNNL